LTKVAHASIEIKKHCLIVVVVVENMPCYVDGGWLFGLGLILPK